MPGHEVSLRPVTSPAEASTQGPWQMTAIGFPEPLNARTKSSTRVLCRSRSGLTNPPGISSPS